MAMFTLKEIAEATGGRMIGETGGEASAVSTDSRQVAPGELFVALRGERFDGHDFILKAVSKGITIFLAEESWAEKNELPTGAGAVLVPDTLRALGDLAAYHRRRFDLKTVCVTGSNGKTTTKEMLATILAQTGPGLKTEGNLNNLIGLPLTIFRLTGRERWAVLEIGMSEFGEIDRLAEIAEPQVGIITNAFPAHLETLGSVEGVARAKGELFLRLKSGSVAVYNVDDPLVSACPTHLNVTRLTFGLRGAEVSSASIQSLGKRGESFTLRLPDGEQQVTLSAYGRHNIYNALAAAAAAHALGVPGELIRQGLEEFSPYDKRFQLEEVAGVTLIDDSYNANPASMAAALTTLKEIGGEGRLVAVLGDMLELGLGTEEAHRELGKLAAAHVDRLYLLGSLVQETAKGALEAGLSPADVVLGEDHDQLAGELLSFIKPEDCILFKGSRGMKMDKVAKAVRQELAAAGKGGLD
ncbi:UDP-N-acetylmuramoyl-tripeptide--D-alanyl-D-alanine ligase [Citrifermentans bremense]|uniref:UDP-N-acetylmuramoyl-tripeptide--D-alanyl-D-alanine ligase n=1 Tax=Citrifermentans bremense TaxID=60035 RepID=A0A6S6M2Y2_9BACT|nr:UDP-N-acetylmuramoyl-tripeptide--D-alanyl-D-alanine ligase [Citrifermentans bremense]BCG45735.1 UDP-N-acetylmuramoyl-tripeptide--D-alanyl-D-alanine ligase [Citrifermentans bremense]